MSTPLEASTFLVRLIWLSGLATEGVTEGGLAGLAKVTAELFAGVMLTDELIETEPADGEGTEGGELMIIGSLRTSRLRRSSLWAGVWGPCAAALTDRPTCEPTELFSMYLST
ncbi:unnamed protein product, partial [Nesidiocoris tenuis]